MNKKYKQPWPTKAAMAQVYDKNLWGKGEDLFYSGEGSHLKYIVKPYVDNVRFFLKSFKLPVSVCDLGCGDFNIGKHLVDFTSEYIAVDIVDNLINYNKEKFKFKNLSFLSLDIAKDDLPKADCVFIRQVLQHLSNKEVEAVVKKLYRYKYLILTEHLPVEDFEPNIDIISGQGIRLKKKSGINLLAPPFNLEVKSEKQLVSVNLNDNKGVLVTTLYQLF
ncbi:class I SAM-dependent methyltransferase [uncultured Polaribacter sp.]|uniref:class I SAM-dependent methyltransferase n=1 Tax=uncultured Polaribacter sp. TaxID=174711 RepID=UPI00260EB9DF|nr:class I SAM-dependent methyltransferase [uncultured Polaribacter sp.]